ncbi:MAG: hypothetical protein LWX07_02235 [Bacteroidetes bacterium]|nr:hypothetical protein [Bacteroidota bacterium]
MKKIIALALFFIVLQTVGAQVLHLEKYKLSGKSGGNLKTLFMSVKTQDGEILPMLVLSWPINPMLVVEDKKPYFALTKAVNLMFPALYIGHNPLVAQFGGEYSYVARNGRNSHIRGYLDFLYPVDAGEYIAFLLGVGGGIFTDTKKSGLFPQLSFSALMPVCNGIAFQAYIKARNNYMFKKEESNVFDLSAGMGAVFYLGW